MVTDDITKFELRAKAIRLLTKADGQVSFFLEVLDPDILAHGPFAVMDQMLKSLLRLSLVRLVFQQRNLRPAGHVGIAGQDKNLDRAVGRSRSILRPAAGNDRPGLRGRGGFLLGAQARPAGEDGPSCHLSHNASPE